MIIKVAYKRKRTNNMPQIIKEQPIKRWDDLKKNQQVKEVGINPRFEQHKRETRFAAPVAQRRWLNERQTCKSRR